MTLFPLGLEQNLHPIPLGPAAVRLLLTICIPAVAIEDQADVLAVLDKMDILDVHESMDILDVHEYMDILDIHDASDSLELTEDLPTASIIPGCEA
ncbi:MAG: hypothetical protein VKI82_04480 [Leptolyngbya sp.]|nr:hypothetical protein [Leptolyngbya sp.]